MYVEFSDKELFCYIIVFISHCYVISVFLTLET